MDLNKVYNIDCVEFVKDNDMKEVNLVVTDPPFNIGFKYNEHQDDMSDEDYIKLLSVFKDMPSVFIQYPEETMKYLIPAIGVPQEVVAWIYNSPLNKQFRLINWFNCIPDFSLITQPYKNPNDKRVKNYMLKGNQGGKLYDWWFVNQVKNVSDEKTEHPCQMPLEIMKRIILLTTKKGDIVFDPFMGSGTTAIACLETDRRFIGCEKDKKYFKINQDRIKKYQCQGRIDI